jgi:tryptophanyl-tRNA synthetase
MYGETFRLPQGIVPERGTRVRAFNDPTRKMSKSEAHVRGHAIRLLDQPDEIRYVIQRAVTDAGREVRFSDASEKAGVNNLLEVYELSTQQSRQAIAEHFAGKGYAVLKQEVAELIIEVLRPIREGYAKLIADPTELERILVAGAKRAQAVAEPKIEHVRRVVGFIGPAV